MLAILPSLFAKANKEKEKTPSNFNLQSSYAHRESEEPQNVRKEEFACLAPGASCFPLCTLLSWAWLIGGLLLAAVLAAPGSEPPSLFAGVHASCRRCSYASTRDD